ncbi:MAG: DMT family transporter [Prevotellaceae bacterium]|jgi:transporter family-2 protein|nr:DMT family transporter [Prevotellaceae bacterium]
MSIALAIIIVGGVEMYYFLSLLTGILIAVLVAFNGGLAEQYGLYSATVIIYMSGLLIITIFVCLKKEKPFSRKYPYALYLGGAFSVSTIIFASFAFGRVSVSAILALGLLGQSVAGLIVDQFGFLGMPKYPFAKHKIVGLLLVLAGAMTMVDGLDIWAVIMAFAAGVTFIVSRTLNAKLANETNIYIGTFYNFFIGFIVSILAFLILGGGEVAYPDFGISPFSPHWYIYTGGIIGIFVILLNNITVIKISAIYLTLLLFVGQVFSAIVIDLIIQQELSGRYLIGAVLVTTGLCVNLLLEHKHRRALTSNDS